MPGLLGMEFELMVGTESLYKPEKREIEYGKLAISGKGGAGAQIVTFVLKEGEHPDEVKNLLNELVASGEEREVDEGKGSRPVMLKVKLFAHLQRYPPVSHVCDSYPPDALADWHEMSIYIAIGPYCRLLHSPTPILQPMQ